MKIWVGTDPRIQRRYVVAVDWNPRHLTLEASSLTTEFSCWHWRQGSNLLLTDQLCCSMILDMQVFCVAEMSYSNLLWIIVTPIAIGTSTRRKRELLVQLTKDNPNNRILPSISNFKKRPPSSLSKVRELRQKFQILFFGVQLRWSFPQIILQNKLIIIVTNF